LYLAIQDWYATNAVPPYFSAIFDRAVTDFYAWTIPKGDLLVVGAALAPRMDTAGKMSRLRHVLEERGIRLGKPVKREGALLVRPQHAGQLCTGTDRVALLGEAAGWISPSSAEGISYAFRSAMAMADALRDGPEDALTRYAANTAALRRNISLKLAKSPFMYHPWLRGLVIRSGMAGLEVRE
jgi:flavin-dependent dehydrogenase